MGHSQAEKAQSRERILAEASVQVRGGGLNSLSVAKLMRRARLTHGGFYGHFGSRSEFAAEALRCALRDGAAHSRAAITGSGLPLGFSSYVRSYLSRAHRDAPATGCAIAALAMDAARAEDGVRQVMSEGVEGAIADLREALDDKDDDRAMVALSTMVGALILARTLTDPARAGAILRTARDRLNMDAGDRVNRHTS